MDCGSSMMSDEHLRNRMRHGNVGGMSENAKGMKTTTKKMAAARISRWNPEKWKHECRPLGLACRSCALQKEEGSPEIATRPLKY